MTTKVKDQDGIWKYQVAINLLIFKTLMKHCQSPTCDLLFWLCCQLLVETIEPPLLFWSSLCSCTFWHRHAQAALFCFPVSATKIPHIYPMEPADSSHNWYAQKWGASPAFFKKSLSATFFFPLSFTHFTIENIPTHKMFFTLPSKRQQSWCTTVVPLCTYAFKNSWAAQYLT